MDKKAVVHIHNGVLLSIKKNTFESVLMRWMKLEPIIQSEVSQKEKHQYRRGHKKMASMNQEAGPDQNPIMLAP